MNGELFFCNDGVLRLKNHNENEPAIPLITIQQTLNESPYMILKYLRNITSVEKGTSLKNFILCLEPWAGILGNIIDRNIKNYIEEVKVDREFTPNEIQWIGIHQMISFQQDTVFTIDLDFKNTPFSELLNKMDTKPGSHYNIENFFTASGMIKGEDDHYSLSGDIQDIKHLPVIIHKYANSSIYQSPNEKNQIKASGMGIFKLRNTTYITAKSQAPTFLEVIEAIFVEGLFYDSPESANAATEQLLAAQASLEEFLSTNKAEQAAKINQSKLRIVEESDGQNLDPIDQISEPNESKKTIVLAEGCFDNLYEDMERTQNEWEYIKVESFKNKSTIPFRVGIIRTGEAPEEKIGDRVMSP